MQFTEGTLDPRVRRSLMPKRVLWHTPQGVERPEALLKDDDSVCVLRPVKGAPPPAVLLDFGRELHGAARLEIPTNSSGKPARVRVRFGESATEAMGTPNQDHTIHDHEMLAPWMGHQEVGNTGYRFVRVDLVEPETTVNLRVVKGVFIYRPLEYRGTFECSDPRLNDIWETGAYTVHLCMQDHVWDGIKRDRLVWIGDMHPETMVASTVFGNVDVVPQSLDYVRDRTPLPRWMNGISSYSLWWILCQRDWYRYHGNLEYLREQRDYLVRLLAHLETRLDPDGRERLDGHRFLEWPTSRDPTAIDAGLQALMALSFRAGAELCRALGEEAPAARAEAAGKRAAGHRRASSPSKQANALAALAGMADAVETNRRLLSLDPYRGLSTFYGYYVLQARALAGDHSGCLDLIRNYWGGMLDLGATTFWEGFELDWKENAARIDELTPAGRKDVHADYGDYCYVGLRHSLCHGWAAGPTAWLTEHVLGLAPAAPGFARMSVRPHLAGLEYARGTLPTPRGLVRVSHERRADGRVETKVDAPDGVRVEREPRR